jgi:hypothetical protein
MFDVIVGIIIGAVITTVVPAVFTWVKAQIAKI